MCIRDRASSHQPNRVILVDSSHGEVDRPSLADGRLLGISDPQDPLELDVLMPGGPADYINWFQTLAQRRRAGGHAIPETA